MSQDESWILHDAAVAGLAKIQATTALATADVVDVQARADAATELVATLAATKAQITAWVPSATYKASDLVAIKGQLSGIIDQLNTIVGAMGEMYTYRKAVDNSTIDINNAIIFLAKHLGLGREG